MSTSPRANSFGEWVRRGGKHWYLAGALLVNAALQVFALFGKARSLLPDDVADFLATHRSLVPAALHLAFIAVFTVLLLIKRKELLRKPQRHGEEIQHALDSRRDLYYQWAALWLTWLALYVTITIQAFQGKQSFTFEFLTTLFNNAQTAALFALGWEMSELTQRDREMKDSWHNWPLYVVLLVAVTLFSASHWIVGPTSASGRIAFVGVAGIAGGVAIALFAGRLDSKVMAPPKTLLVALYFYACIQALFPFLFGYPNLELALLSVALVLKVSMFLLVYWLFVSGRIVYYSWEIRKLIEQGDKNFAAFLHRYFGSEAHAEAISNESEVAGNVVLIAAMSSLPSPQREEVQKMVKDVESELLRKKYTVSHFVGTSPPFDPPPTARAKSFHAIAQAEIVVALYTHAVASSLLIELGVAVAMRKKLVVLSPSGVTLPYLLRNLEPPRHHSEEYETVASIGELVATRCDYLRSQTAADPL